MLRVVHAGMLGLGCWLFGASGCLPNDTRPEPGRATLYAVPSESLLSGFSTEDGWRVDFEEFFISLGDGDLRGATCSQYSESDYLRILDMRRPEKQRLATFYALGTCEFSFRVRAPGRDAVLGEGVEDDLERFMRSTGSDDYVEDRAASLHVRGVAQGPEGELHFTWTFRRDLQYSDCGTVEFVGGESGEIEIHIRGDVLFRAGGEGSALLFGAYAGADDNGDGDISLDELAAVPVEVEGSSQTLADRVYLELAPAVVAAGSCIATSVDAD